MAEGGEVFSCHSKGQRNEHFDREKDSKKLVVVDFTASWCGPCRFISPVVAELAKKMTNVLFLKVDVDELKEVAEEYQVEAMPTFVFIKEGQEIDRIVGAEKNELESKTVRYAHG